VCGLYMRAAYTGVLRSEFFENKSIGESYQCVELIKKTLSIYKAGLPAM